VRQELVDIPVRLRAGEAVSADEMNEFVFFRGLRPCPHSYHSHDEEFDECVRESDLEFLKSVGISTEDTSLDADRMALAQRIAKHQVPGQVNVDPQAASRQLIRLSLEKLLNASEE